jgi:preprotein translocase subunit SecF
MEIFKHDKTFDFMSRRLPFLGFSLFLVLASVALLLTRGLNFGVDFAGGTIVQIKYSNPAPINEVRDLLNESQIYDGVMVNEFGSSDEIIIKLAKTSTSLQQNINDHIATLLKPTGEFEVRRVDMVGPKVGNELQEKGIMALLFAIAVILVYVSMRFEWRFAVASVFALVHDVTIALGALSLFAIDINLDILAAILTILGYSLNDTIIVFDRIREGVNKSKSNDLSGVINDSVSRTLSRTTLTSLTTFFVVLTLFVFGGEIIKGFSFTLLIGIVVGTYSSIFVAASFLVLFKFSIKDFKNRENVKKQKADERARIRAQYEQGIT